MLNRPPLRFGQNRFRYAWLMIFAILLMSCAPVSVSSSNEPVVIAPVQEVAGQVELLGVITIANSAEAFNTLIGGLSAIAYDEVGGHYYFLSDDRAMRGPVRIYQATIDMTDGTLDEEDLAWTGVIFLQNEAGERFGFGQLDPEGLVYADGHFFVSTEGEGAMRPPLAPEIIEFTRTGEWVRSLPLPEKFMPVADGSRGVRNNKGLESLTITPDGRYLISGVENALAQDGPIASTTEQSPVRLLTIDLQSSQPMTEQVYLVDTIPVAAAQVRGEADNGLAELLALDDGGTLWALERAYVQGVGNTVRLYGVDVRGAEVVTDRDALGDISRPAAKARLVDFGELGAAIGVAPDNLEGMALGPRLPDGRQVLFVVSDNNFNASQRTQLWALALE